MHSTAHWLAGATVQHRTLHRLATLAGLASQPCTASQSHGIVHRGHPNPNGSAGMLLVTAADHPTQVRPVSRTTSRLCATPSTQGKRRQTGAYRPESACTRGARPERLQMRTRHGLCAVLFDTCLGPTAEHCLGIAASDMAKQEAPSSGPRSVPLERATAHSGRRVLSQATDTWTTTSYFVLGCPRPGGWVVDKHWRPITPRHARGAAPGPAGGG